MADQKLRAVPPSSDDPSPGAEAEMSVPGRSGRRVAIVLGVLLALTLALLVWSRMELGERVEQISGLEEQVSGLQGEVTQRDVLIRAQKARLSDVRGAVRSLMQMLDKPVAP